MAIVPRVALTDVMGVGNREIVSGGPHGGQGT